MYIYHYRLIDRWRDERLAARLTTPVGIRAHFHSLTPFYYYDQKVTYITAGYVE